MTSSDTQDDFRSRSRQALESFLQSVVVLDDRPEMPASRDPGVDKATMSLTLPDHSASQDSPDPVADRDPAGADLNAAAVIAGFADVGSVCAVLSATRSPEFRTRAVGAARRADIVVLDWTIEESTGDEALAVLREILTSDQQGQRLRLIAIYAGEPNLDVIRDRVQEAIHTFHEEHVLKLDGFRLSKGPLHVVILAKEGVVRRLPEFDSQETTDSELANRLIEEFALMTGGLLWNSAIAGIATIRDNAHRVLAKFERGLDAAYLGHRLLLPHPPDAEDHVEEALGAEITSAIQELRPGSHADVEAIRSWLTLQESGGVDLTEPFSFRATKGSVEGWGDLLLRGLHDSGANLPRGVKRKALKPRVTEPFAEDSAAAAHSNRRFAALLSLKTRYPGWVPRLTIGTIMQALGSSDNSYLLCLQPKCDSVRLESVTGFPLVPLISLEGPEVGSNGEELRLVVEPQPHQWEYLGIETKPSDLMVRSFKPCSTGAGEVVATQDDQERFLFVDVECQQYLWIAELKDEHALKIAGEVASALARPGHNDSEWLRLARGSTR